MNLLQEFSPDPRYKVKADLPIDNLNFERVFVGCLHQKT